jgi:TonB-linked SusC/RagA family outer membrane protein
MNCTAILLTFCFLQVAAHSNAQDRITYSGKDVPLSQVFNAVTAQAGYRFFYKSTQLKDARKVTIQVKDATVEEVLKKCLDGQPFIYIIEGKFIFIELKKAPLTTASADEKRINVRGKLINKSQEPVVGATITVKGTSKVVISNEKGEFLVNDVEDNATLYITTINYEPQEISINGREEITLQLDIKTTSLAEVSVSISTGFQEIKKNRLTGSVTKLDKELINRRVSSDILSRLEGVASGVMFDKRADNSLGISIRGRSTIYANTQPLIVLDNLPFQGSVNDINPNDVESISILKDAAAASLWGALAGNGVIVITTKRGKNNQPVKMEINSNLTLKKKPDLYYDKQFLNSNDYINLELFLFSQGLYDGELASPFGPPISPVIETLNKRRNGIISASDSAVQIDALRKLDVRNDYLKYLYRTSVLQQYSLNISGGNARSNYYLSGGYDKDLTNVKHNDNDRITLNGQLSFSPIEKLEISTGLMFIQQKTANNGIASLNAGGRYATTFPYTQLADADGTALPVVRNFRQPFAEAATTKGLLDWTYTPLEEYKYNDSKFKTLSNRINTSIKYTIFSGLSAQISYLYQHADSKTNNLYDEGSYYARNLINRYSTVFNNQVISRGIPQGAIMENSYAEQISHSGRGQINFLKRFYKHEISAIAGMDIIDTKTTSNFSYIYGYDKNTGSFINVDYTKMFTLNPEFSTARIPGAPTVNPYTLDRFRSYFGNTSYTYADKYTFTLSGRIDQSNLFGVKTNQKSVPLWSTGARWDIANESFYHVSWLPFLTVRISYGYNGNLTRQITAYTTIESRNDNFNFEPFAQIYSPGNPQLKWEKIGIFNLGLDFSTKNSIISGTLEYYRKKGIDMIGSTVVPSSTGYLNFTGNYSDMKGSGVDVNISSINLKGAFNWTTNFLFSYSTDEVTKNKGTNLQLEGRPINSIYAFKWGGLDPSSGDPIGYLADTLSKNYSQIIAQAANEPTKYVYKGSASPRVFGAFRNTFTYKGVSISANITFKADYYFLKNTISYSSLIGNGIGHADFTKRWKNKGDEASTNVPSFLYPINSNRDYFYQQSEVNVKKGDHIRFQDVNVSYTIGNHNHRMPFSFIKMYFYANNLGILWKANNEGIDPDFVSGYPNPKTYSVGVNIGF